MRYIEKQIISKRLYLEFLMSLVTKYKFITDNVIEGIYQKYNKDVPPASPSTNIQWNFINSDDPELTGEQELNELDRQIHLIKTSIEYEIIASKTYKQALDKLNRNIAPTYPHIINPGGAPSICCDMENFPDASSYDWKKRF